MYENITFALHITRPYMLLVPAAKSLTPPPPAPLLTPTNHFKCYKVKGLKFSKPGLVIDDEFGTLHVDIKKPFRFCPAVNKNNEGIPDPNNHLLCYKIRTSPGFPTFRGVDDPVFITDQFQSPPEGWTVKHLRDFCVPSQILP